MVHAAKKKINTGIIIQNLQNRVSYRKVPFTRYLKLSSTYIVGYCLTDYIYTFILYMIYIS